MGERMTSRDEADILKREIDECANSLERLGFDRGQIGAALAGIGLALVQVHHGQAAALRMITSVHAALTCPAPAKEPNDWCSSHQPDGR